MKIRTYEQQYSPSGGSIQSQANSNDFGGQIGAADEDLAGSMYKASDEIQKLAEAKDQVWRNSAVSAYQLQQFQKLQEAKTDPDFAKKYGADGANFASGVAENLTTSMNQLAGQAPSPRSARALTQQLTDVNTQLMGHALSFQAETGGAYMKTQASDMMQNDAKLVMQSPSDTSAVLDRGKLAIAQMPYLTPEQKSDLLHGYEQNIAMAAGKGLVLHKPESVLAAIAPDVLASFKPTPRVLANTSIPVTGFQAATVAPTVEKFAPVVQQYAAQYNVDPNFMKAQLHVESRGNPAAVNNNDINVTGSPSVGIAQFQPATAAQYGIDPTKPDQAIKGQAMYMSDLLKQFGGDYRKAAAAYNWGPGNLVNDIAKHGNDWLTNAPESTQNYIKQIFAAAPPVSSAETSFNAAQQQQNEGEPSRAPTNPDWFNKLDWKQQFEIISSAEQGVRANQVRDAQTLALQEQQRKAQQQQLMNDMFNRIGADKNPLTVAEVRQSDLDYQGKEHMLEAINKVNRGDAATDPQKFDELFNRINLPAGDPNKISDDRTLIPYMGHGISYEDLQRLRGEMKGRNTPDGAAAADLKKNFFTMAKGQIDTSTFISNDPIGKQKYYQFQQKVISTIDAKTRAGADVLDLFNPDSKDYLGKLIPLYQRTPAQQMQDYSQFMSGANVGTKSSVAPRQPGESPADYLKRTGKAQ